MGWLWPIGLGLFAVAAGAVFMAFRNPAFIAGLAKIAVSAAWKFLAPTVLKPETPEAREKRIEAFRRNEVPATKQRPHPGEGGHR